MTDGQSKLPLQYADGPDYCTVKDAQGSDFALTMQPELMRAMEKALREDIARLMRAPAQGSLTQEDIYANCWTTLIGFSEELTERDRKFICDQVARKVILAAQPPAAPVETKPDWCQGADAVCHHPACVCVLPHEQCSAGSETVIGADGKSRPITLRETIARAALRAIEKPDGVETLDWQIADAVIAVLPQPTDWAPASAASFHIPAPKLPTNEPQAVPMLEQPQYIVEGIILRRLHEKRIEGYTIETAKEIADALALSRPEQS